MFLLQISRSQIRNVISFSTGNLRSNARFWANDKEFLVRAVLALENAKSPDQALNRFASWRRLILPRSLVGMEFRMKIRLGTCHGLKAFRQNSKTLFSVRLVLSPVEGSTSPTTHAATSSLRSPAPAARPKATA